MPWLQRRDLFGLNYIPLRAVYMHDRNHARSMRWQRYLDSRKLPAELPVPGSGAPGGG